MTTRVRTKLVVFAHSFLLPEADGAQPAGTYTVETEEELLETASFASWRRVSTTIHCCAAGGITRFINVDPLALDAALARDAEHAN